MKVNLLLDNPQGIRDGYLNLDPFGDVGSKVCKRSNLKTLDDIDDAELEELVAVDVIDYYPPREVISMLQLWVKKLRHGGMITIGFQDIYQLTKAITNRLVNLEEANLLIHGTQDKAWHLRRSSMSTDYVSNLLEQVGLKVINKRLLAGKAIIKAVRP